MCVASPPKLAPSYFNIVVFLVGLFPDYYYYLYLYFFFIFYFLVCVALGHQIVFVYQLNIRGCLFAVDEFAGHC
jgi:hypothetical protein